MKQLKPYFLLTVLCLILFLPGISAIPVLDRDSARFTQASVQMIQTHDYWQVNFQNKPRHLKPPGIYWLQAASDMITGHQYDRAIWPFRLPSVLGAWLAALLLYGLGARLINKRTAFIAATILASGLLITTEAHIANTDSALLATTVLMQLALGRCYLWHRDGQSFHWIWPLLFWLGMTAGIVIKGVSPLFGLVTWLGLAAVDRDARWLKAMHPVKGLLLTVLLTLAWLIPLSHATHSDFLWNMIHQDLLPKLAGGQESHGHAPGFLLLILPLMFWPMSLYFGQAVRFAWRERKHTLVKFLLVWLLPCWIILELVPTKLPEYPMPLYPAIALLVALSMVRLVDNIQACSRNLGQRLYVVLWALYTVVLATVLVAAPLQIEHHLSYLSLLAVIVLVVGSLWQWWAYRQNKIFFSIKVAVATAIIVFGITFSWTLPHLKNAWITQKVQQTLEHTVPDGISSKMPLLAVDYTAPSLVFTFGTHSVHLLNEPSQLLQFSAQKRYIGLMTTVHYEQWLARLHHHGWRTQSLSQITGFRYNGGYWMHLTLFRLTPEYKNGHEI